MAITEQDRQVLQANEGHMLSAKDGWVQQVYDLSKLHEIYERNVAHYPLTTWCPSCVVKFMQRLGTWWDGVKSQPKPEQSETKQNTNSIDYSTPNVTRKPRKRK